MKRHGISGVLSQGYFVRLYHLSRSTGESAIAEVTPSRACFTENDLSQRGNKIPTTLNLLYISFYFV